MHIISFTNLDGFLFTHSFETLSSAVKFIECLSLLCLPFHHYFEE